jgi:hypothetical protein
VPACAAPPAGSCQAAPQPISEAAKSAAIAQLVEHVIRNDGVGGSNPSCGTIDPPSVNLTRTLRQSMSPGGPEFRSPAMLQPEKV